MDKDFISSLEFLTTDVSCRMSTTDLVEEFEEHFCHVTLAVARDTKQGLEGSPKVSRGGGNVNAYQEYFSHLTLAAARDGMDLICAKAGLTGSPKARGIREVLKVGIAAFKEHEDAERNKDEVVSLGDFATKFQICSKLCDGLST